MAKAGFTIVNGIRVDKKAYLPGEEKDLEKVLDSDRIEELIASGDLRDDGYLEEADLAREASIAADSGEVNEFTAAAGAGSEEGAEAGANTSGLAGGSAARTAAVGVKDSAKGRSTAGTGGAGTAGGNAGSKTGTQAGGSKPK